MKSAKPKPTAETPTTGWFNPLGGLFSPLGRLFASPSTPTNPLAASTTPNSPKSNKPLAERVIDYSKHLLLASGTPPAGRDYFYHANGLLLGLSLNCNTFESFYAEAIKIPHVDKDKPYLKSVYYMLNGEDPSENVPYYKDVFYRFNSNNPLSRETITNDKVNHFNILRKNLVGLFKKDFENVESLTNNDLVLLRRRFNYEKQ